LLNLLNNAAADIPNPEAMEHSAKVHCLIELLTACQKINEKVLVFSRSIPTLDYLEKEIGERLPDYSIFRLCGKVKQTARPDIISGFHSSTGGTVYLKSYLII
jgi:SNF2 family DNA or RNA helicase